MDIVLYWTPAGVDSDELFPLLKGHSDEDVPKHPNRDQSGQNLTPSFHPALDGKGEVIIGREKRDGQ